MVTILPGRITPVGLTQLSDILILKVLFARPSWVNAGFGTVRLPFFTSATYWSVLWKLVVLLQAPAHLSLRIFPFAGFTKFAPFGARTLSRPWHPVPVPGVHVSFACTTNW